MVSKIVVLCISPIGDTLFATPAIRALRDHFTQARIVVLAGAAAHEVFRNNPYGLELVKVVNLYDLYKTLSWVREQRFDLALGLSRFGSLFTKMCGAADYADFSLVEYNNELSVVEVCLRVLATAGQRVNCKVSTATTQTNYWLGPKDISMASHFLEWSGYLAAKPLVAVHCGGHYFSRKRWPVERFIQLIQSLNNQGFQVVLIGGKEDLPSALAVRMAVPETMTAVGMLKLSETGALLQRCQLFIGNDSGPLHLAAALHVPTVALFGPTRPRQFHPYPSDRHLFLIKEFTCHPCYQLGGAVWQFIPRCPKAYCMEAIAVEEVMTAVDQVLAKTNGAFN